MDNKIQMIKWLVRISIGIDIFLAICFVIGFVLASMKVGIGLFLWGIIVFCGVYILAISFILKIFAMILCMPFDTLEKIKSVTQQKFLHTSPACFIVGSDANQGWVREADSMNFADVDASIVATHIMLAIQDQGLASTWIGNFQPEKIKEVFPMMESYNLIAIFPVGYPEEDAKPSHLHTTRKSEYEFIETL